MKPPGRPSLPGVTLLAFFAGFSSPAFAQTLERNSAQTSGFGFGARALGMGGAFVAIADDASAVSWNPGGLGQLLDPQLTLAASTNDYETKTTSNETLLDSPAVGRVRILTDDGAFLGNEAGLDFAAFVLPFTVGSRSFVGSVSYLRDQRALRGHEDRVLRSFQAPPGNDVEKPAVLAEVEEVSSGAGGIDSFVLGLATSFGSLHVGAGMTYHRGTVRLSREERVRITSLAGEDGTPRYLIQSDYLVVENSTWPIQGLSLNVGALWKPLPWLSIGAAYRGGWSSEEPYDLSFRTAGYDAELIPDGRFFDLSTSTSEQATLHFPDSFGGGLAVRPVPALTLAFDATWTRWSEGYLTDIPYVARVPGPECPPACLEVGSVDMQYPSETPLESNLQRDQLALRVGAEYVFRPGRLLIPLRAGAYHLPAIAPLFSDRIGATGQSFDTDPETAFVGLTAGIGVVLPVGTSSRVLLDLAGIVEEASSSWRQSQEIEGGDLDGFQSATADRKVRNRRLVASLIVYF